MADTGKKVEVRFGSFSCSIEGYDDPVEQMREVLLLVQRMIRETPALAEYEPEIGDDEIAQIESALARHEGDGGDGSPRVVVIRAGATDPRLEPEDAVTTAEMQSGWQDEREGAASALGEMEPEPEIGTAAAGVAPVAPARDEDAAETVEPERALDDETGAEPTAAAMFAAPAAEVAGSVFTGDDERREPAGTDTQTAGHEEPAGADAESGASEPQPDSGVFEQASEAFEPSDEDRSRVNSAAALGEEVADPASRDGLEGVADESIDEADAGEPRPDALVDGREPDGEPKEMEHHSAEDERWQADVAYHLWDTASDPGDAGVDAGEDSEDAAGSDRRVTEPSSAPGESQDWGPRDAGTSPAADASFDPPVEESVGEPRPWMDEDASAETTHDEWRADSGEEYAVEPGEHGSGPEAAGDEHRTVTDHDKPNGRGSGGDTPWPSGREVDTQAPEHEGAAEPEKPRAGGDGSGIFAALAAVNAAAARATAGERGGRAEAEEPDDSGRATANIFSPPPASATGAAAEGAEGTRSSWADQGGSVATVNIFAPPARTAPAGAASVLSDARAERGKGLDHLDDIAGELAAVLADERSDRNIFAPPHGDRSGIESDAAADVTPGPEEWAAAHSTAPASTLDEERPVQGAWRGNSLVFAGPEDSTADAEARRHDRESQPDEADEAPALEERLATEDGALGTHAEEDAAGEDGRGDRHPSGDTAGPGLGRFSALLARLGGRGAPEPQAAPTDFPGRSGAAGPEGDPAGLAKKADARSVPDLLAVAAAWLTLVEGKQRFTRREVMEIFENLPGDHPRTLEARIKGFGQLVRSGILVLVADGVFAMAQAERDRFQALLDRD